MFLPFLPRLRPFPSNAKCCLVFLGDCQFLIFTQLDYPRGTGHMLSVTLCSWALLTSHIRTSKYAKENIKSQHSLKTFSLQSISVMSRYQGMKCVATASRSQQY